MNSRKIRFYFVYFFFIILFFEIVFRVFFSIKYNNRKIFINPQNVIYKYYPSLQQIKKDEIKFDDDKIDILLLGGSVLSDLWGKVPNEFENQLQKKMGFKIKIHNAATPSHTSLDSRIKYNLLVEKKFDIIILYHGINEQRFNNCPEDFFKNDYSHVNFYNLTSIIPKTITKISIIPYTYKLLLTKVKKIFFTDDSKNLTYIRRDNEWLHYGNSIKTKMSFKSNYLEILKLSIDKNETIIVPTFAYYKAENYNFDDFMDKKLDYNYNGFALTPIEVWGIPSNVIKGIDVHNTVIKEVLKNETNCEDCYFVSMNERLSKGKKNFNDVCHFTDQGSKEFVKILLPFIINNVPK